MTQSIAQLFDLTGKAALVTGGGQGIGQAIAFRLAEAGAGVLITDIDLKIAGETVKEIKARGGKALALHADAASVADAKKAVQATVDAFGHIDILVNNAGIYPISRTLDVTEEMWNKVLDLDLKGVFFHSQAAIGEMVKAGRGGRIINIASTAALRPGPGVICYDVAKAGVAMLTKSMAAEFSRYNILVNAVAPGPTMTPTFKSEITVTAARAEKLASKIPLKRAGEPDDVAKAVLFLASAAADYIAGTLVVVDGGCIL